MSLAHPSIAETFGLAGFDFLGIDLEHSTIGQEQAQRIIAAAHAAGVPCLPRISSHNSEQAKRLLDSGAAGLIVPQVSTREQVERLVEWCKYPPVGKRSYGVARAQGYGFRFEEYVRNWNARSSIIIQIESIEGVDAADELLACPEVDGVMVGPYDLSGSLGIPGQLEDRRVVQACTRVIQACRRRGKACGTQLVSPSRAGVGRVLKMGYTFAVLASDVFVLWKWSERMRALICACRGKGAVVHVKKGRASAGRSAEGGPFPARP
ncbi:MAG: 4-hydroxy-2-oxovalerate aldolase [Nitrospirae bacterium]|nr:4-hydroxy-2-oxovalerate aldolase [Nitrospirota bacterium]